MNIYYKFESAEDLKDGRKMVLMAIFEPDAWDYLKTIFGLIGPIPRVKEYIVEFFTDNQRHVNRETKLDICYWKDKSSDSYCSLDMCEMLERLYYLSIEKPGVLLIGRI